MLREDVIKTAEISIKENKDLLRLLASEEIANKKIMKKTFDN